MGCTPGWGSLWMVHPFVLAPNFVLATPSMGVLFPILRRNEISTVLVFLLVFYELYLGYFELLGIILSEVTQSQKNTHDMHLL